MTVTTLIIALISVLMSIVIAIGKGDWLIAGYNTSSKEEKEKVNIKRLRLLTSILLLLVSAFVLVMPSAQKQTLQYLMIAGFWIVLVAFLILANTWCKKK
ncbi:MAG: DUF3784 domain-containing protein [Bacteroidaceae bacterium]|nr:DUF3784 domain-containing protein [Bacteroidaceae bacterium]